MRVVCTTCGETVPGADIDVRRGIGVCRRCSEVVPLPAGPGAADPSALLVAKEITGMPLHAYRPHGLEWEERREPQRVRCELTPNRGTGLLVLLFALLWNSFLLFWYSYAVVNLSQNPLGVLALWFPLLHLGAGILLVHTALCMLLNKVEITLGPTRLAYTQQPLWHPGAFHEPLRQLRSFIEVEKISKGRRDRWFQRTVTFGVMALTKDGRSLMMNLYLPEQRHARYVALRLNRALDELRAQQFAPPPKPGDDQAADAEAGPYRSAGL